MNYTIVTSFTVKAKDENEADYLESKESVDENIKCNEYEFTKEGLRS